MTTRRFRIALAAAVLACGSLHALYLTPEIAQVPVTRIVANLEKQAAKDPKDVESRLNLARAHGMAYALGSETVPVAKWPAAVKMEEDVWFGHEPALVPYAVERTGSAAATAHLAKAIDRYQEVLKIDPAHRIARLGLAWCLHEAGRTQEAIEHYRRVIAEAWPVEHNKRIADLRWRSATAEAARYLIPLLDPARDREEIAELRRRIVAMEAVVRPITPIAIPLRDGAAAADVVDLQASVLFDADGSGVKKRWTWIAPGAGWLVHAPGGADVRSALQLFGGVTFWMFWDNGYHALRALDDDGDGWLRGGELQDLAIWRDGDGDGVSGAGEVAPLERWGITALSTAYRRSADLAVIAWSPEGLRLADGRTRPTYDVWLHPCGTRGVSE